MYNEVFDTYSPNFLGNMFNHFADILKSQVEDVNITIDGYTLLETTLIYRYGNNS